MNQKTLLIAAAMFATLMATAAAAPLARTSSVQQAFAQVDTTQEGITDDDDTTNISSTPTKIKDKADCNISGFSNECDIHSGAGIGFEDYLGPLDQLDREE